MSSPAKPRLIYVHDDYPSFAIPWVQPIVDQYFEFVLYDPAATYDRRRDFVLVTYASRELKNWYKPLVDQGHGLIVDHLWDSDVAQLPRRTAGEIELFCPNWMWYLACIEFSAHGYESYRPNRQKKHAFLMLMNNPRWHRDSLISMLYNVLPYARYSYNHRGIQIDGDKPDNMIQVPWQRYMNPVWYDTTAFSVVAESYMRNSVDMPGGLYTEVSEKIFKPLAYFHPFIVAGSTDSLKYLQNQGFETYNTWFDESYDSIIDDRVRLATVCSEIDRATQRWWKDEIGWDKETIRRTEHNHAHMFNRNIVMPRVIQEIIEPALEFCECYVR